MGLFSQHSFALKTIYSDLKQRAFDQTFLLVGTPGSVGAREVRGHPFLYRQFYDPGGKKSAEYIGAAGDEMARMRAAEVREVIAVTKNLLGDARLLAREGYVRVESRTNAILASLANHGLFRAGAVLVGSHAYGALLNELGIESARRPAEEVEVARAGRLKLARGHESFAKMLEDSSVPLGRGRDRVHVELHVPAGQTASELEARATARPHLEWLLAEPIESVVLGKDSVVPVRVPGPERFVLHELLTKRPSHIRQAAVLAAALAEADERVLLGAVEVVPRKARTGLRAAARRASELLAGHPRGRDLLLRL
jgi:hypothetical protein